MIPTSDTESMLLATSSTGDLLQNIRGVNILDLIVRNSNFCWYRHSAQSIQFFMMPTIWYHQDPAVL